MEDSNFLRDDFIIITGGPGAGKTTLLDELQKNNHEYVPEVARKIIQTQISSNGDALPWGNVTNYRDLMLDQSIESYLSAFSNPSNQPLFFDRGIPDALAYSYLINIPTSEKLESAVKRYRYNKRVFILPPWKDIYKTDAERKQDFEEAVATYKVMFRTYEKLEYELIEVPKIGVKQRVSFILNNTMSLIPIGISGYQ
ncbi:ATP-binding protein [Siminovitchia terrae]|uniref:ATP-binding protein n=1 Tax=Siminovitchia terrae TaxID=1914933 RepID=A0A429X9K3_SIMTE|nr:AAA family ATPase [Siminovitchia terrae]RST59991.1 ATPase [Siminovitchia terrae]GIN96018.1 ATP-binding protein [Siminovitchia terrae]